MGRRRTTAKRLRFGAFVVLAIFAAIQVAAMAGEAGWPPSGGVPRVPSANVAVNGHAYVTDYEIGGVGGSTPGSFLFQRSLACNGCAIRFYVTGSSLTVAGSGWFGVLSPDLEYEIGNFHGHVGISNFGPNNFALTLDGVAEKVRVAPDDYPYLR